MKHGKRPVARIISLSLLILTLAVSVYILVETEPEYNKTGIQLPFEGLGTETQPYLIASVEDAVAFSDFVNKGKNFAGTYFKQTADLDFSTVENWIPIGDLSTGFNAFFYGVYDGGGHTIENISCSNKHAGYFGLLGGEVRNLGIESGCFTGETVGSIASHGADGAIIYNCYNKADVYGIHRAGGIVDNFPGDVLFCLNSGKVTSDYNPAGLVSYNVRHMSNSYCTDLEPIKEATFTGELKNCRKVSLETLRSESFWEKQYAQLKADNPMIVLEPTVVYMVPGTESVSFAADDFLPELFRDEYNKSALLSVLPEILLVVVVLALLILLPLYGQKIKAARAAAATTAIAANEAGAQTTINPEPTTKETTDTRRKNRGKRVAAACAFVLVLALMLNTVNHVLLPKRQDGITNVAQYRTIDSGLVDVLVIGSSMSGINFEFETFWSEYGISVFGLGSGVQPLWDSYYRLREGVETNKPKVVVLDVTGVTQHYEYSDAGVKTTSLLGLPMSLNRIEAVRAACPQGEWLNYIFGFGQYHGRFSSLTNSDFSYEYGPFDWGSWYAF